MSQGYAGKRRDGLLPVQYNCMTQEKRFFFKNRQMTIKFAYKPP